jgi:hypothetical protein
MAGVVYPRMYCWWWLSRGVEVEVAGDVDVVQVLVHVHVQAKRMSIRTTNPSNNTSMPTPKLMAPIPNLPALVRHQFKEAQENGHLTFYETRVSVLHCNGLPASRAASTPR